MKELTTLDLPLGKATVGYGGCFTIPYLGSEIAILAPTRETAIAAAEQLLLGLPHQPLDAARLQTGALVKVSPILLDL